MANIQDIHDRELGAYHVADWLGKLIGVREAKILECRTCCHFPHKLNNDLDDYINDACITYSSKIHGQFTVDTKTQQIIN